MYVPHLVYVNKKGAYQAVCLLIRPLRYRVSKNSLDFDV